MGKGGDGENGRGPGELGRGRVYNSQGTMAGKILFDESYLSASHSAGGRLEDPAELAELRDRIERTMAPIAQVTREPAAAARSDRLVPLAAVGGAVLAVAVTALLASISLSREVDDMALKSYGHTSGEGRVLQQYRADSERRIEQKDSEVRNVLQQLETLRQRTASLSAVVEKGVDIRSSQMAAEVEAQLARERAQLAAHGTAEAEAEGRIKALRERLEQESRVELDRVKRQADEALVAQRTQLLASLAKATEELAQVAQQRAEAAATPERGPTPASQEDLAVTREIAASLAAAVASIERSDYATASALLAQARGLLSGSRASQSPSAAARRAADLDIVRALEGYATVLRAQRAQKAAAAAPPPPQPAPALGPVIGRVTLVEGRRIIIETLVATPVARGAVLQVLRLDAARNPRDVVLARVQDVSGTRIVADVEGAASPSVTDPVHLPVR